MDLKVDDAVITTDHYNDFFGYSRSGIVKYIQYGKYITVKCDDNILRIININWLKKMGELLK